MSTATVPAGGGQVPAQVHPAVLNAIQCFPEILGLQGQDSPYTITKPIGSGVSGTAFLVVHHGKKLIAKITHLEGMNAKRREYARNEIHCLAQCEHFAIVKHHAHFEKETHLLLVMELADAGDLERQIAQRARGTTQAPGPMYFQEHEVAFLFLQVILAVDYVHRSRMLHRDLKSANVFVLSRGITKIGDFGFSQQYDDTVSGAVAGTFCGTPYYLAPELWRRQRYSKKADVWALGVLLYEMAALRRPFVADSMINLMDKVMSGHVDPFPEAAGYSPDLFHVVRWALTFDQYARPDTKQLLAHPYMQMTMKEFVLSVDRSDKFSAEEKRGMFSEITAATAHLAAAPSAGPSQQDIYAQTQAHAQQQAQVQAQQQQHAQHQQQVQYAPGVQQVPVHNMQQVSHQMQNMAIQQQHPQTVAPPSPHHQMPAQQQHQVLQQAPPQHQQQQPQQQVVVYQDSNGQQYQQQAFHHQQQLPPGAMVVRDHNGQQIVYVPITTPTPPQHQQQHVPAPVAPAAAPVVVGDAQAAHQQVPQQSVPMQQQHQQQPVQGTSSASATTAAVAQPPHLPTQTQPQGEQASRSQRARGAFQPCEGLVEKRGSRGWRRRRLILNADTLTVDLIPEDGAATPTNGGGGGGANSIAGTAPGVDAKSMPVSRIGDVMPLPANASAAEGRPAVFAVAVDGGAQLLFQAESAVARDAWIDRIREAMITDDCRRFA